jgi:hypothetical protein
MATHLTGTLKPTLAGDNTQGESKVGGVLQFRFHAGGIDMKECTIAAPSGGARPAGAMMSTTSAERSRGFGGI